MSDFNNYNQQPNDGQQQYAQQGYTQQPNGEYNPQFGYGAPVVPEEKKGQSIASLVLGLCSFIAWLIPLFGYPVTIVGIIMGASGMKKGGKGMAIAGIICSVIGLLLTLFNSVLGVLMVTGSY